MPSCCQSESGQNAERLGAVILLAWWLFRGFPLDEVHARFETRFRGVPEIDYQALLQRALQAREAGRAIGVTPSQIVAPYEDIPIEPGLPEPWWEGGRVSYDLEARYSDPATGEIVTRRIQIKDAVFESSDQILDKVREEMVDRMRDYPERFPRGAVSEGRLVLEGVIISAVRRY